MNRLSFLALSTTLALALTLTGAGLTGQAAPPTPESPPPRPRYEGLGEIPFFDTNLSHPGSRASAAPLDLASWSKIAFTSYRDDNWEIYLANGDGSGQTRLTSDSAIDVYPRLNRGCTRIAFASDRTGNYEIFTMNLAGSGLTRLTSNNTDDVRPAWSPAGTKIAFQAYRDSQAEIYVMNADGSGQARLTQNSAYDGEPVWSPDGTRIAFVSIRTGGYGIWVMNADGSGQTPLASQPYSEHPVWSPDGTQIAYDADGNSDGWQELWVMNADGSNQYQVYDPPEKQTDDAWAGSWSPDGRYVIFTRIAWVYYKGDWYWTSAYLDAWDKSDPWITTRLSGQGTDWYPDWQTLDIQAPKSRVFPLPTYSRNNVTVSWGSSEAGGSGIKAYDVQYRDTSTTGMDGQMDRQGTWTDWQVGTAATAASFDGIAGHTVSFRSRATDNALNMETWPLGDGDTYTTFYTWGVSGVARDNTDTPISGAVITTAPEAFTVSPSSADGAYAAYVADGTATYTAIWTKGGYGALPATGFSAIQDAYVDVVFPPNDNAVRNWGFESGSLGAGDWTMGGVITPAVTSNPKHTGDYAALLGQQWFTFTPAWNLSNNNDGSFYPQLVTDKDRAVHVVWYDGWPGEPDIFYARRSSNGAWSSPQNISNNPGGSWYPQLAVDEGGAIHVVWYDSTPGNCAIFYARRSSSGTWSTPCNISISPTSTWADFPQLAIDRGGSVHVVWHDYMSGHDDILYARRDSTGTWSGPQTISASTGKAESPQLAVDGGANVHVVWQDSTYGHNLGDSGIFYAKRSSDGTWSSPQDISNKSTISINPQLVTDSSGVVHVAWLDGGTGSYDIVYAGRSSAGTWSGPYNISRNSGSSRHLQLAVGEGGTVHIVWEDSTPGEFDIFYANRSSSGVWSSPRNISNNSGDSGSPQLAVDGRGIVHVVWQDQTVGNPDIFYARRFNDSTWSNPQNTSDNPGNSESPQLALDSNGTPHLAWHDDADILYVQLTSLQQAGDSSIGQALIVPTTMTTPILSFLYRLGGVSPAGGAWFNVQVNNGISATTIFSTASNTAEWTHRWFGFSPWASQTVTLTFNVHLTAGGMPAWAYLDEVTLGSAYPDLWVSKSNPTALPGKQVAYRITYGNRGGAAASGVRITDTLPTELSFVAASSPPFTTTPYLVWAVAPLSAKSRSFTMIVTTTVASSVAMFSSLTNTVRIGTISMELETANNLAYAATFIGHRIYLPLVMKGYFD